MPIGNRQQPYTANRQQSVASQNPFTYSARYPANGQQPNAANVQTPFTYSARYPANA